MNTPADQAWSQDAVDPMIQMTNELDDLSTMFNIDGMDNFDLDTLPNLDNDFDAQVHHSQPGTHSNSPFEDNFGGLGAPAGTAAQDFGGHNTFGVPTTLGGQQQFMQRNGSVGENMQFGADSLFQPSMQQQYRPQQFQFQPQQTFFSGNQVPPTPNSFELHGESGRFMQQQADAQQCAMLEQQHQMRKNEQIHFTPLASPSGTPQFHVAPEFTVPGAYFSPLTSPALHAQNSSHIQPQYTQQHQQGYYTNSSTAPSSAAPSPLDPNGDVEMGGERMALPEPAQLKKPPRKKAATPRSLAMSKVKQSPIQKAQKRKSGMLSSVTTSKDASGATQSGQQSGKIAPNSAPLQMPRAFEGSENDSVSPEALSDALMGPPPKPTPSISHSPALSGQQQQGSNNSGSGPAATPNSLLSTKGTRQAPNGSATSTNGTQNAGQLPSLDDFQLPEAAEDETSRRPSLAQLNTQIVPAPSIEPTPRMSARKTPKLGPFSTPSSAYPPSVTASPSVAMSPMTASTPAELLKEKSQDKNGKRGGGGSKKRGSVSASGSNLASPAIRPRISPSIKPLLPEGTTLNSPTHALLLASKSNYQNLLEGNRMPGVNYPDSLSTGLTSKRTSHKVAEQGRRNRINDALKEMQSLIPSSKTDVNGGDGGGGEADHSPEVDADGAETKESIAKSNSSKAATVESANRYLRVLKDNDLAQKAAILELRREVALLRRQLGGREGSSEPGGDGRKNSGQDGGRASEEAQSPDARMNEVSPPSSTTTAAAAASE